MNPTSIRHSGFVHCLRPVVVCCALPSLLVLMGSAWVQQGNRVELDHVFIVISQGSAAAVEALQSAGLTVAPDTSVHPEEGTASLAVLFENAYLELIWIDSSLSVAPDHAITAQWFRDAAAWRTTGHSPFGLGLRRAPGDTAALPVPVEREAAPWLGPGAAYEQLRLRSDSLATDLFVVPVRASVPAWINRVRTGEPEQLRHPGGGHEITLVRLYGPATHEPPAFRPVQPSRIEMLRASEPVLEIHLDHDIHGQTVDLRPVLPLIIIR